MSTGALGTAGSQPGRLILGSAPPVPAIHEPLVLYEAALSAVRRQVFVSEHIELVESNAREKAGWTVSLTGVLGTASSQLGNFELGDGLASDTLHVTVSESLNLTETASYPRVDNSVSESLSLSETAVVGRRVNVSVSEAITFDESEPVKAPSYQFSAHRLNLSELATGHASVQNQTIAEIITLLETAGRRLGVSVDEVISLVESTKPHPNAADVIALIEAAIAVKLQAPSDAIDWAEVVSIIGSFGRGVSETMTLTEAAAFFLSNPSLECTYSPMIGSYSGSDYTPPPASGPVLGTGTLTLTYPYSSPTTTLVLRNPEFGNSDKLTYNRLNQTTRGGTLTVFADPQWPKFKTRSFHVTGLSDAMADSLLQFLEDSLGQEIGLLDWEGRQWHGLITNPDTAISHEGDCDHSASIDFEGDLA